jgi:Ni/Co efflux regulator RcnB
VHRGYRYLSTLFLTAALAAPVALMATANAQDDKNHEEKQGENNKRYYDKAHKDYHTWDSNEDRAYQRYQTDHHERRAFVELNPGQQTVYWNWRHNNPDVK